MGIIRNPSDQRSSIPLSDRQRGIVAAGVTALSAALVLAFTAAVLWSLFALLSAVSIVLTPLLVAMILTLLFKPYYQWLFRRLGHRHMIALPAFFLSVLLPLGALFFFFGALFVNQLAALFEYLPKLFEHVSAALTADNPGLHDFLAKFGLEENLTLLANPKAFLASFADTVSIGDVGDMALAYGMDAIRYLASLVGWLVVPIYLVYFLMTPSFSGQGAEKYLPFLKAETRRDVAYLIDEFLAIIVAYFRGQAVIAFAQGLLFGLGFWLAGLPYGLLIGLSLGCLNLVPYLGNIVGLAVALPMALFGEGGSAMRLGLVFAVFCAVQLLDGYFITPRVQGKRTGLSPVAIIFSLLFWGVVFKGILGILLAVPLSAFVVVFWRLLKAKYIRELL